MYSYGSPHMATQKQGDQHERTFSSYVRIQDVVLKTYLGRWTIGRSGERGSGISVLPARYDDDEMNNPTWRYKVLHKCIQVSEEGFLGSTYTKIGEVLITATTLPLPASFLINIPLFWSLVSNLQHTHTRTHAHTHTHTHTHIYIYIYTQFQHAKHEKE